MVCLACMESHSFFGVKTETPLRVWLAKPALLEVIYPGRSQEIADYRYELYLRLKRKSESLTTNEATALFESQYGIGSQWLSFRVSGTNPN